MGTPSSIITRIIGDERKGESSISCLLNKSVVTTIPLSIVISHAQFLTLRLKSLSTVSNSIKNIHIGIIIGITTCTGAKKPEINQWFKF